MSGDGWIHLDEENLDLFERVRARSGIITAEATVVWLIRHMAEHYSRIDRESAKDRAEGPVAEDPKQVPMFGGAP